MTQAVTVSNPLLTAAILAAEQLFIVTRRRSYIGLPSKYKDACRALGLRKLHHTNLLPPSPKVVGNLALLRNLVVIKLVKNGPFPEHVLSSWLKGRGTKAPLGFYIEQHGPFAAYRQIQ